MEIKELFNYTESEFNDLKELMRQLNPSVSVTRDSLDALVSDSNSHLYVMTDTQSIIGTACLCIFHQPFRTDATIEAVVIDKKFRGQQLGKRLVEHLVKEAERFGVDELHLTSAPHRVAANALYQQLGFIKKDTNCYIMDLRK